MTKAEIRRKYKKERAEITESQHLKWDDLLLIRFQELPVDVPEFLMTYAPMAAAGEFDPEYIIEFCRFRNPALNVCYPVINQDKDMVAVMVNADTAFSEHQFGMEEPIGGEPVDASLIDLVIVPLLAFDKRGYRVGYGKGYYDNFLKNCRKDCVKVGTSYFAPVDEITDIHDADVRLDYCLTPEKLFSF